MAKHIMTIGYLRKVLSKIPEDMDNSQVLVPLHPAEGFTGEFFCPCTQESGIAEMGLEDLTEEEIIERKLLGKELKVINALILVPCNFSQQKDQTHKLN